MGFFALFCFGTKSTLFLLLLLEICIVLKGATRLSLILFSMMLSLKPQDSGLDQRLSVNGELEQVVRTLGSRNNLFSGKIRRYISAMG